MREFAAPVFITPFGYDAITLNVTKLIRRGYDAIAIHVANPRRRKLLTVLGVVAIVFVVAIALGSVDVIGVLNDAYNTPWLYMLIAFVYAILVAIILPIPIEIALILPLARGEWGFLAGTALAIAAGKTIGAWLIFWFGLNLEGSVRKWSDRWSVARWFVAKAETFVGKTGYTGIYLLLSVPLMSDTIPIYVYSLFNSEGKALERNMFLIANFLAALNRVAILGVALKIGTDLFAH
ncbi:MAG TPA: hypothetical protein VEO20_09605 [Thermoplasmata archaeon]|nr:hypothetical protein [Thermoplasmata archaeon]